MQNKKQYLDQIMGEINQYIKSLKVLEISENWKSQIEQGLNKAYEEGGEKLVNLRKEIFFKKCKAKSLKIKIARLKKSIVETDKEIAFFERDFIETAFKRLVFDLEDSEITAQEFVNALQNLSFTLFREQSRKDNKKPEIQDKDQELEPFIDATEAYEMHLMKMKLEDKEKDIDIYKRILDFVCANGYDKRGSYDDSYQLSFLRSVRYLNKEIDFERLEEIFKLSNK